MRIHSKFQPIGNRRSEWVELLNQDEVYDGGSARVVPVNAGVVLKATSCAATNQFLKAITRVQKQRQLAFPCVLGSLGHIAIDQEGIRYHSWLLERLFLPSQVNDQLRARALFRHELSVYKPGYKNQRVNLATSELDELQGVYKLAQQRWGTELNWKAAKEVALQMSLCTTGSLRDTFLFLLEFIQSNQVPLDLTTQGNIMVDMFGQPCLSDPVAESIQDYERDIVATGNCVVAMVPIAVCGITVELHPFSTLTLAEKDLTETASALARLGLSPAVCQWGSKKHRRFIQAGPLTAPVWEYPKAAKRICRDEYLEPFYG